MHICENVPVEEEQHLPVAQVDNPCYRGRTVGTKLRADLGSADNHAHLQPVASAEIIIIRPGLVPYRPVPIKRPEGDDAARTRLEGECPVIPLLPWSA